MARKLAFVAIGAMPDRQLVWALYISGTLLTLVIQVNLRPLAGADRTTGRIPTIVVRDDRLDGSRYRWEKVTWTGGSANLAESLNLLVQATTVGLGGLFLFGAVSAGSGAGFAVGVFVIVINFLTLIPALKLVATAVKGRLCAGDEGERTAPLLAGAGGCEVPQPEPEPELAHLGAE